MVAAAFPCELLVDDGLGQRLEGALRGGEADARWPHLRDDPRESLVARRQVGDRRVGVEPRARACAGRALGHGLAAPGLHRNEHSARILGFEPASLRSQAQTKPLASSRGMFMLTLHLVRHGETLQAADGIFAGDIDPPLTDRGLAQAEALGSVAARLDLAAVYVSPKLRARQTAAPVLRACKLEPIVDDGLREIAYGAWEGRKESEVQASDPGLFAAWTQDPALVSPPGGESAFAIAARRAPVPRARAARAPHR